MPKDFLLVGTLITSSLIVSSIYGSTMVTLGSLLLWAMTRALLPDNAPLRTAAAIASSIVLLKTGQAYLNVIDSPPAKKKAQ